MGFPNIGPGELILILIIALIVLGPGKLPDVASSLGKSVREFRKAATDVTEAGRMDGPASTPAPVTPVNQPVATPAAPSQPAAPPPPPPPAATSGDPARDPSS